MKNKKIILIILPFIIAFLIVNHYKTKDIVEINYYEHQKEKIKKQERSFIILEKPPFLD